jgi:hypothetical protein
MSTCADRRPAFLSLVIDNSNFDPIQTASQARAPRSFRDAMARVEAEVYGSAGAAARSTGRRTAG